MINLCVLHITFSLKLYGSPVMVSFAWNMWPIFCFALVGQSKDVLLNK